MKLAHLGAAMTGIGVLLTLVDRFILNREPEAGDSMREISSSDKPLKLKQYKVTSLGQRVGYIAGLVQKGKVHPEIRRIALHLVRQTGERDYLGEARAIFNGVRKVVKYRRDINGIDTYQHPVRTLEFGGGDCDDYTILLCSLYESVGFPTRLKVVRTKNSTDWNHIYGLVGMPPREPTKWMAADASLPVPFGWEAPRQMIGSAAVFDIDTAREVKE